MTSILDRLDAVVHHAIVSHPDRTVHLHVLQSILWLADIVHYKSYLVSVTWARRHRLIDGIPTAEGVHGALDRLAAHGQIDETRRTIARSPGVHYRANGAPDVTYVSERSLHTIRTVAQALGSCTARQARKSDLNRIWRDWPEETDVPVQLAAEWSMIDILSINERNWARASTGYAAGRPRASGEGPACIAAAQGRSSKPARLVRVKPRASIRTTAGRTGRNFPSLY